MKLIDHYYKSPYLIRYAVFNLYGLYQSQKRYGKNFKEFYTNLMNNQEMSKNEIIDMQTKLMKKLLIHAYENTNYYKRIFDDIGFSPYDFSKLEELNNIPVLTKEIIRDNYKDLVSKNTNRTQITMHSTGGTTGKPIRFYLPKSLKGDYNYASLYRFYSWANVSFRDRRVSIAGRLITKKPPYAMINLPENQLYVCAHFLRDEYLPEIIRSIKAFNPKFIQGHPSAITVIASHMKENNISIPVKAIFTTSENLYTDQRKLIESVFNGPVFDTYGMGEMVLMASECSKHKGYHLAPEYGYTEIINANYIDEIGEIVSTSLQNYAMPLIRYKTGDLGKLRDEECSCGLKFSMLEKISGRIDDVIEVQGVQILPLTIRTRMKNKGYSEYQVVQYANNKLEVNFFNTFDHLKEEKTRIHTIEVFREIVGTSLDIAVNFGINPELTLTGKQQMIVKK